MLRILCLVAVICASFSGFLWAQQQEPGGPVTLKVGDPAPELTVGKWIKGEPVQKLEKGQVYVIEFWATWCGPCVAAVPHLSQLQKQYQGKNVTVIGQNVWEMDSSAVEPFVQKMGDKMSYRVVMDDVPAGGNANDGKMAKSWMEAAGQDGIPCSFVIDRDTKIAWIGHPMAVDGVLKAVVEGTYDAKKQAQVEADMAAEAEKFGQAMRARRYDEALTVADGLLQRYPERAAELGMLKFGVLLRKGDLTAAAALIDQLGATIPNDAGILNSLAWELIKPADGTRPTTRHSDAVLATAERMATRANELTEWDEAALLDTLARVHYLKRDFAKAVELQTKAVEKAESGSKKSELRRTLRTYTARAKSATQPK